MEDIRVYFKVPKMGPNIALDCQLLSNKTFNVTPGILGFLAV